MKNNHARKGFQNGLCALKHTFLLAFWHVGPSCESAPCLCSLQSLLQSTSTLGLSYVDNNICCEHETLPVPRSKNPRVRGQESMGANDVLFFWKLSCLQTYFSKSRGILLSHDMLYHAAGTNTGFYELKSKEHLSGPEPSKLVSSQNLQTRPQEDISH